jgi:hypothetical protein
LLAIWLGAGGEGPQNKELKLTKPARMELRSLTLCSADYWGERVTAKAGTRTTSAIIFAKGLILLIIGGTELVRAVTNHATVYSPLRNPPAPLEPEWPALALLACGVWDVVSYRALRDGESRAWLGGLMSAAVVLLYAVLGTSRGVLQTPEALWVAAALALVSLTVFRQDYRTTE